ncbi:MAG: hypothetical protein L3J22_00880 [Xanthomonadales bacterium]|nr:hypothetical protein [Xanthomonadales bacterium]
MKKPFVVISYGGCGSKFLVRQISRHLGRENFKDYHSHQRTPDKDFLDQYEKVIFIFGDPINSVKSFFGRRLKNTKLHSYYSRNGVPDERWAMKHCKHLKGNFNSLDISWTLDDYLKNGEDLFLLEEFFCSWINNKHTHDVLFIKYEKLWEYTDEIKKYLGFDDSFITHFEEQQQRSSTIEPLSEENNRLASIIHGSLTNKIANIDDYWIHSKDTNGAMKSSDKLKNQE